jgi:hypothetical protein
MVTTSTNSSAESLAEKLAAALLNCGRNPCERVQLMVGIYPDDKPDGGMCRAALVELFTEVIQHNAALTAVEHAGGSSKNRER